MRVRTAWFALMVVAVVLPACGGGETATEAPAAAPSTQETTTTTTTVAPQTTTTSTTTTTGPATDTTTVPDEAVVPEGFKLHDGSADGFVMGEELMRAAEEDQGIMVLLVGPSANVDTNRRAVGGHRGHEAHVFSEKTNQHWLDVANDLVELRDSGRDHLAAREG